MMEIILSNGMPCQVDDADYERLSAFKWHLMATRGLRYAYRGAKRGGKQTNYLMHREIIDAPAGVKVDHQDRNGLNNQRSNLRLATSGQNSMNMAKAAGKSSQFKGVSWHTRSAKWRAVIKIDGKQRELGKFTDERAAADAYDLAAKEVFGEFARTNNETA